METPKKVVQLYRRKQQPLAQIKQRTTASTTFFGVSICKNFPKKENLYIFHKMADRLLRNYQLRIKCECTKLLSERPVIQFICRGQCYQRLTTFKRALDNLNKAKGEIEEVFKANGHRTKRLRRKEQIEEDIEEEKDEQLGQSAQAISSRKIVSRSNGSSYPFKKICEPCSNFKLNVQSELNFEIAAFWLILGVKTYHLHE